MVKRQPVAETQQLDEEPRLSVLDDPKDAHQACFLSRHHSRATSAKKGKSSTRYRRQSRRGSQSRRQDHSRPECCIQRGARGTDPATKLKLIPTQTAKLTPASSPQRA